MRRALKAATMSLSLATAASAQPLPDYGFDWVTVGNTGNADATWNQFPGLQREGGGVDHMYRITSLPVSIAQWIDFAHALDSVATSQERSWLSTASNSVWRDLHTGDLVIQTGRDGYGATSNFMLAAMYCNWMHNGQSGGRESFDDSAYDMSSFYINEFNHWSVENARRSDAQFWIPTFDEHAKAAYYDPNRYGTGEGGYWLYPHGSNAVPIYGPPSEPGAESSAGVELPAGPWTHSIPPGLYPETMSPYGLFDVSGGVEEWTDSTTHFEDPSRRLIQGSAAGQAFLAPAYDDLGGGYITSRLTATRGFRLATVVPSPGALLLISLASAAVCCTRRRSE